MPLYDYRCGTCGKIFEVRQNFSDAKLTVHEDCGGPLERLISAPALQFKGSGFYITDYARGSAAGSKAGGKSESKSEGKSESKSDSKSDSSSSSSSSSSSTGKSDSGSSTTSTTSSSSDKK